MKPPEAAKPGTLPGKLKVPHCQQCGREVVCEPLFRNWGAFCWTCYDGAPDTRSIVGIGDTEPEALQDFRNQCWLGEGGVDLEYSK